jgi:hypothetical protein
MFFFRSSLVKDLCTHVGTENNTPAWIVLYCLSTQMEFKNPMFAVDYYRQTVGSNEVNKQKYSWSYGTLKLDGDVTKYEGQSNENRKFFFKCNLLNDTVVHNCIIFLHSLHFIQYRPSCVQSVKIPLERSSCGCLRSHSRTTCCMPSSEQNFFPPIASEWSKHVVIT